MRVMFGALRRVGLSLLFLVVLLAVLAAAPVQADVRVHGATTVAFGLLTPQKSRIEQLASAKLVILPSSTGNGLADLAQGRADIAMLAEPLATAAAALNKKEPGSINPDDYRDRHVGDAWVQFIVHPSNPIQKLTEPELASLYSGKIRNWSELGGANQGVLLVGEPTSSPYRLIRDALAISYATEMRSVQNTNQTAIIVAQAPGALSNISTAHTVPERSKLKVLETEVKIPLRLYLAVRKDAPAEVARVVDAAVTAGAP
jgi:phosphate transport system substrate-binding protein